MSAPPPPPPPPSNFVSASKVASSSSFANAPKADLAKKPTSYELYASKQIVAPVEPPPGPPAGSAVAYVPATPKEPSVKPTIPSYRVRVTKSVGQYHREDKWNESFQYWDPYQPNFAFTWSRDNAEKGAKERTIEIILSAIQARIRLIAMDGTSCCTLPNRCWVGSNFTYAGAWADTKKHPTFDGGNALTSVDIDGPRGAHGEAHYEFQVPAGKEVYMFEVQWMDSPKYEFYQ